MREIEVNGCVRRAEVGEWTDKQGVVHPNGSVVLDAKHDKLEIGLDRSPDPETVGKLRALRRGADVTLLVGVKSGDNYRAEPVFLFLDDLTSRPKG